MRRLKRKIKQNDMFGHQIGLTFNKKGSTHKTFTGGTFSILIKVSLAVYVIMIFKKMFLREDDSIFLDKAEVDFDDLGNVLYNETSVVSFYKMIKQQYYEEPLFYNNETKRYIRMNFEQFTWNQTSFYVDFQQYDVRQCDKAKDFGALPEYEDIFDTWKGYSILCPDLKEGEQLKMHGDATTMFQQSFEFQIYKCDNYTLNEDETPCATPEEIDEYIRNIEVQKWAIYEEINFSKYKDRPTKIEQRWITTQLLEPRFMFRIWNYFRRNKITDDRHYIPLFNTYTDQFYDISKTVNQKMIIEARGDQGMLYSSINLLNHEQIQHRRNIYNLFDVLGDIGGVLEVISFIFGLILLPVSYHSFILKASSKFFLARTKDDKLFQRKKKSKKEIRRESRIMESFGAVLEQHVRQNREIKISFFDSSKLFITRKIHKLCGCKFNNPKLDKYHRLYRKCETKLIDELDIIRIIKFVKGTQILLKNEFGNSEILFQLKHNARNVIDLDNDSPEEDKSNLSLFSQEKSFKRKTTLEDSICTSSQESKSSCEQEQEKMKMEKLDVLKKKINARKIGDLKKDKDKEDDLLKDSRDDSVESMTSQQINAKSKDEKNFGSVISKFQKSPESASKGRVLTRSMKRTQSIMLIDGMVNSNKKKSKIDIVQMLPPSFDHMFGKQDLENKEDESDSQIEEEQKSENNKSILPPQIIQDNIKSPHTVENQTKSLMSQEIQDLKFVIEERKTDMHIQEESMQHETPVLDSIDQLVLPQIYESNKAKPKKSKVSVMEIELDKVQTNQPKDFNDYQTDINPSTSNRTRFGANSKLQNFSLSQTRRKNQLAPLKGKIFGNFDISMNTEKPSRSRRARSNDRIHQTMTPQIPLQQETLNFLPEQQGYFQNQEE